MERTSRSTLLFEDAAGIIEAYHLLLLLLRVPEILKR
jgi:hypothetical protein